MNFDLQKASIMKRVSAWLLDMILLCVLAAGCFFLISDALDLDQHVGRLNDYCSQFEQEYGISFKYETEESFAALSEEEQAAYEETVEEAYRAMSADREVLNTFTAIMQRILLILGIGTFLARAILDFLIPLWFKNGQTIGKKLFSLGVVRTNSVKINGVALFIRSILGKYTIETMVPIFILFMMFQGLLGSIGLYLLLIMLGAQLILMAASVNNSTIHDKMSDTVVVDLSSQRTFESQEERQEYSQRIAAEKAEKQAY